MIRGIGKVLTALSVLLLFNCSSSFSARECVPGSGIRITKYPGNYMAFKFMDSRGIVAITDPYMMDEIVNVDIVTESHFHTDHTDTSKIRGDYRIIDGPGDYSVKSVAVRGVEGDHNRVFEASTYGQIVNSSKNTMFVFDFDGIRIAHLGAQGAPLTDEQYRSLGQVDILIIQVLCNTDSQKLLISDAVCIVDHLEPKFIIPAHGDTLIASDLAKALGVKIVRNESGIVDFSRKGIDEAERTVLVLDRYPGK